MCKQVAREERLPVTAPEARLWLHQFGQVDGDISLGQGCSRVLLLAGLRMCDVPGHSLPQAVQSRAGAAVVPSLDRVKTLPRLGDAAGANPSNTPPFGDSLLRICRVKLRSVQTEIGCRQAGVS